jgi:uridine kinase
MKLLKDILSNNRDKKILIMPIGIFGSGKTTLYQRLKKEFDIEYISFDRIREEIYKKEKNLQSIKKEDYKEIYRFINENKIKLLPIAKEKMKKSHKDIIYVDNTNLKRKSRNKFLCISKGYLKIAIFFYPNLKKAISRQYRNDRDKIVPPSVILQQYQIIEPPGFDEFDIIIKKGFPDGKSSSNNWRFKRSW